MLDLNGKGVLITGDTSSLSKALTKTIFGSHPLKGRNNLLKVT